MGVCSVLGCKSRSDRKDPDITFHSFPKDKDAKILWINATGRLNWQPSKESKICSLHFKEGEIRFVNKIKRINPDAVPTQHIHSVEQTSRREVANIESTSHEAIDDHSIFDMSQPSTSQLPTTPSTRKRKSKLVKSPIKAKKLCMTTQSTPRKEMLKRKLIRVKQQSIRRLKKLRASREATRRLKKKNANLETILTELKNKLKIGPEQLELLANVEGGNLALLKGVGGKKKKYSESLRKFSLCLHFISPKAYSFVRNHFDTCLPHPKTLYRWYSCVDCQPGFTQEAFTFIKAICSKTSDKVICALSLDEMAIRQHVQWDGKKSVGYVNIGENLDVDRPLAKDALVFMLTSINDNWKLPIGYFFTNGVNGEQRSALLKNCIQLISECGVTVASVTFDGCPANFAMCKYLGAKFDDLNNLDPTITVNGNTIVAYPDPCHMIKLIRNCFADKNEIIDGDDNIISWQYIQNLHKLQESEGVHLGNKLRKSHIHFKKQIMKVRLATQTLSKSVAESLAFLKDQLNLEDFKESGATIKFILHMNNIFDIMNSRRLYSYKFKKPISIQTFTLINSYLKEFELYTKCLRFTNEELVLKSGRKTGFLGLLICVRSLQIIYERYIQSDALKYLCTYKLSQDHLELFFSAIRSKGGFNNNPTAIQFQSAYKRLLIHGELKNVSTGNAIPLESINILTCNKKNIDRRINNTRNRLLAMDDELELNDDASIIDVPDSHDYVVNTSLTEFTTEVTKYIGGFIVSKMYKTIKCEECLAALISLEKYKGLILQKDVGGLHYPSQDVINICLFAEKILRSFVSQYTAAVLAKDNMVPKMMSSIMKKFIGKPLFSALKGHEIEQHPFDNHAILLLKAISFRYLEVRIHFLNKSLSNSSEKIRNFHNKLILFKGQ